METLIDSLTLTWKEEENLMKLLALGKPTKHKFKDKYIVCNETGKAFKNRAEIARYLKCQESTVCHYFKGLQKTVKGFTFTELRKRA